REGVRLLLQRRLAIGPRGRHRAADGAPAGHGARGRLHRVEGRRHARRGAQGLEAGLTHAGAAGALGGPAPRRLAVLRIAPDDQGRLVVAGRIRDVALDYAVHAKAAAELYGERRIDEPSRHHLGHVLVDPEAILPRAVAAQEPAGDVAAQVETAHERLARLV